MADERGQALVLALGLMLAVVAGAALLGAIAAGLGAQQEHRGAADLAALAGAETMRVAQPRLFEPAQLDRGVAEPAASRAPGLPHAGAACGDRHRPAQWRPPYRRHVP